MQDKTKKRTLIKIQKQPTLRGMLKGMKKNDAIMIDAIYANYTRSEISSYIKLTHPNRKYATKKQFEGEFEFLEVKRIM